MNWVLKLGIQKLISIFPNSSEINYFLQRQRGAFPVSDPWFVDRVGESLRHIQNLQRYSTVKLPDCNAYEFGAGWDLIQPLTYAGLGVKSQHIIDIAFKVKFPLVNNSIHQFQKNKGALKSRFGIDFNVPSVKVDNPQELLSAFKINYVVQDARRTSLDSNSIDFNSSTATFEHIPKKDLEDILKETHRSLKPNGIVSCHFDLTDHGSHHDKSISPYNFLKFSPREFDFFNSNLLYQNRLRYPEYEKIIKAAGFKILQVDLERGTDSEIEQLKKLKLHSSFKSYSIEDLSVKIAWMVFQKI